MVCKHCTSDCRHQEEVAYTHHVSSRCDVVVQEVSSKRSGQSCHVLCCCVVASFQKLCEGFVGGGKQGCWRSQVGEGCKDASSLQSCVQAAVVLVSCNLAILQERTAREDDSASGLLELPSCKTCIAKKSKLKQSGMPGCRQAETAFGRCSVVVRSHRTQEYVYLVQ